MNRIIQIKNFNGLLDQFFDFIEESFYDFRSDIILTRSTTEFIRKSNPRLVVEEFMQYVSPYSDQIFGCDESFFLNFEKNLASSLTRDNLLFGMKLKSIWQSSNITDIQKATVFFYFQKLLKAGSECIL